MNRTIRWTHTKNDYNMMKDLDVLSHVIAVKY